MNPLKTYKVFFTGLAAMTAVKKKQSKTKQSMMIQNNLRNKQNKNQNKYKNDKKTQQKTNQKTTIYQDKYVLHSDIDSW